MAYGAVDEDGVETKFNYKPFRCHKEWGINEDFEDSDCWNLEIGTIEKLIGRKLTWEDEPVELKEE